MIYFLDFDYTIGDTSPLKKCSSWKEAQKFIPEIKVYPKALEFIEIANKNGDTVYIVSGNVGSTIKQTIQHFKIPISLENVYGYRFGYPMQNLQRKFKVIQEALKHIDDKSQVIYIGDEEDDEKACQLLGIKFEQETFSII